MADSKLDVIENEGWILTISDINKNCAYCKEEIKGRKYFCPKTKALYCEECDELILKSHAKQFKNKEGVHEHFNIIKINFK